MEGEIMVKTKANQVVNQENIPPVKNELKTIINVNDLKFFYGTK